MTPSNPLPDAIMIVFTGSSIMAQWESLPQFFPGLTILNTAISGSRTSDIYAQLNELVMIYAPAAVCYYCGSNDINYDVPASAIVDNVIKTHENMRARLGGFEFIFLSIIKAPQKMDRWDLVEDVNAYLSAAAEKLPGFHYIDVNPVFFTEDEQPRMNFYQEDQLHLTPDAYLALGAYIAPRMSEIIKHK